MVSIWTRFERKRKTNCLFQQKKDEHLKFFEIEMSLIPSFDVIVNEIINYSLLLKSFCIHLNLLSFFKDENLKFLEIETCWIPCFDVIAKWKYQLVVVENGFQFIWFNWAFFFFWKLKWVELSCFDAISNENQ